MATHRYSIIVGNVGTVYSGNSEREADESFDDYKKLSCSFRGRAGGENVTMFVNGEIRREHVGADSFED